MDEKKIVQVEGGIKSLCKSNRELIQMLCQADLNLADGQIEWLREIDGKIVDVLTKYR